MAVAAAFVLTQTASSAPLEGAVRGVGDQLISFGQDFQRFLPTGGANRPLGVQFGQTSQIVGQWVTRDEIAFSVQFQSAQEERFYWRAAVYDRFELSAWTQTVAAGYDVAPGEEPRVSVAPTALDAAPPAASAPAAEPPPATQ